MDSVLLSYVTATDARKRQQHLDDLLAVSAAPVIRKVLRQRLGFYVSAQGVNPNNQDAEDLYQEAMMRVVQGLNQLQSRTASDIEDFELYVSRIAANICIDFLRTKSPARTRLKYSLRDLLKRHKDIASWEHEGEILCGLAVWRNAGKSPFSDQSFSDIEAQLSSFQSVYFVDEDVRQAPLARLVSELFDWIAGPVEVDLLVRMVAYLLDLKEQPIESLDDPSQESWVTSLVADMQSGESHLATNELLARLWHAIMKLPAGQRDAFAFGFQDEAGQDLFTVLVAAVVVGWGELALGMARSVAEVVHLRQRMPMDSAGVAAELGASRENVRKLRFRAIRRLKTELRG